jgi:hypothetical protein
MLNNEIKKKSIFIKGKGLIFKIHDLSHKTEITL